MMQVCWVVDARATEWLAQCDADTQWHDVSDEGQARGSSQRLPTHSTPDRKRARLGSLILAERKCADRDPPVEQIKEAVRPVRNRVKRFSQRATVFWRRDRRHREKRLALPFGPTGVGTQRRQHEFAVDGCIDVHLRRRATSNRRGHINVDHRARRGIGQELGRNPHQRSLSDALGSLD